MINSKTGLFWLTLAALAINKTGYSQTIENNCRAVKNGHFYSYLKSESTWSEIFRNGDTHIEVKKNTNDTMFYRVNWLSPCTFTFDYVRSTLRFELGQEQFNKSFKTNVEIRYVGEKFYTYKATMSSSLYPKELIVEDTIWTKSMKDRAASF